MDVSHWSGREEVDALALALDLFGRSARLARLSGPTWSPSAYALSVRQVQNDEPAPVGWAVCPGERISRLKGLKLVANYMRRFLELRDSRIRMSKENKSRYALLGILNTRPMSGYGIKKYIEQSISNFWQESYGQIYPMLKQLTAEELVTSHVEKEEGKPERYIYTITDKGQEELRLWLEEPVEYQVRRDELLLKLFFGSSIPANDIIEHIRHFRTLQEQLLQKYSMIAAKLESYLSDNNTNTLHQLLTVRYGLHKTQALIAWCDETIATLQQ